MNLRAFLTIFWHLLPENCASYAFALFACGLRYDLHRGAKRLCHPGRLHRFRHMDKACGDGMVHSVHQRIENRIADVGAEPGSPAGKGLRGPGGPGRSVFLRVL